MLDHKDRVEYKLSQCTVSFALSNTLCIIQMLDHTARVQYKVSQCTAPFALSFEWPQQTSVTR